MRHWTDACTYTHDALVFYIKPLRVVWTHVRMTSALSPLPRGSMAFDAHV